MYFFGFAVLATFLLRLWLSGFGGLHPDEAYYWAWAQGPWKLGYYDHPPMVAWIIKLGGLLVDTFVPSSMLNESPVFWGQIGLRLFPYFLTSFFIPLALGRVIELVQRRPLRVSQMAAILTAPVFVLGPQIITPDAPLFAAWTMALFFAVKFQRSRPPMSYPGDPTPFQPWRAARMGLILAFAAYSKYSAVLAAFLFVVTGSGLLNAVVAATVTFVLILPHLWWNWTIGRPEDAGIFFQMNHGFGGASAAVNFMRMGDLIVSQLFFWTPFVFLGTLISPIVNFRQLFVIQRESKLRGTLFLWAMTPVAFFSITSLKKFAEANWPLIGFIPGIALVLSACYRRVGWLAAIVAFNMATLVLTFLLLTRNTSLALMIAPYSSQVAAKLQQPSRLHEFENWDRLHQLLFESTKLRALPVEVQSYQVLSELLFYDAYSKPEERFGDRLLIWPEGSRKSQFNLDPLRHREKREGPYWLVVRSEDGIPSQCLLHQALFKSATDLQTYSVYRCGF